MDKLIYTYDEIIRDKLIESGYMLLKNDEENSIFIFVNNPNANEILANFALESKVLITSNILTF